MLPKKQPWQWPLTFEQIRRLTNWPNIATKFARRGTIRSLLLSNWSSWHRAASATQWAEYESNLQSPTSPGESCARLPAGLRPHRHFWCLCWSTWNAQKMTVGIKGGNLLPLLLQVTLASPTICTCLFHIFGLSMLPNVVKETAVTMALNIRTNKASNELAKHRNQVCKTRHERKFASRKLVQLAPRSFCHAVDGIWEQCWKFNFSRGELHKASSRSAAPSAPLVLMSKHLECSKEDCGDVSSREDGMSKKVRLRHLSPHLDGAKCKKPQPKWTRPQIQWTWI